MMKRWMYILLAGLCIAMFIGISVGSALRESLTYDEIVYIEEGKNAWLRHTFDVDTNNPPFVRELAVLPLILGINRTIPFPQPNMQAFPARAVVIFLGATLGAAVFFAAMRMFGWDVALFSVFLFVFEPTILVHSHYVTLDVGATLFFFLSYIFLVSAVRKPTMKNFLLLGVSAGLMAASKITALFYFSATTALFLGYILRRSAVGTLWRNKWLVLGSLLVFSLTIWASYFFRLRPIIAPREDKERLSSRLVTYAVASHNWILEHSIRSLQGTSIPLGDYIGSLKNTVIRSKKPSPVFFLGTLYPDARWYFMLINALLKTPLPLLFLLFLGVSRGFQNKTDRAKITVLSIPVISVFILASMTRLQPFVRYVLPAYPFLILIAAISIKHIRQTFEKVLIILLCAWYAYATLSFYPHMMAYANDFAGNRANLFTKFSDSNIDWGQSLPDLQAYVENEKPSNISFSYFGRDDAAAYGLPSDFSYGSYKFNEICAFHEIHLPSAQKKEITVISISNWRLCGYYLDPNYTSVRVKNVVGNSFLIFSSSEQK